MLVFDDEESYSKVVLVEKLLSLTMLVEERLLTTEVLCVLVNEKSFSVFSGVLLGEYSLLPDCSVFL